MAILRVFRFGDHARTKNHSAVGQVPFFEHRLSSQLGGRELEKLFEEDLDGCSIDVRDCYIGAFCGYCMRAEEQPQAQDKILTACG